MKRSFLTVSFAAALGVAALAISTTTAASAAETGEYDFGEFAVPESGAEFVEVNLTRNLIAIAARLVGKDEPDVAAVLAGLHGVRVHVVGVDDANRAELTQRMSDARNTLSQRGWERVVTVRESGENVDVYVKTRGDELIDGVVVTVLSQGGEAVFINVVGNIRPEQLVTVGERFGIKPLQELSRHTRTNHGG